MGTVENDEPNIDELKAIVACFVMDKHFLSAAWADSQYPCTCMYLYMYNYSEQYSLPLYCAIYVPYSGKYSHGAKFRGFCR